MSQIVPIKKQMKFAVVMYGGGSLAIYINGVAQELLRMAQSTNKSMTSFDGTTSIYRKIALLLSGRRDVVEEVEKREAEIKNLSGAASDNDAVVKSKRDELQKLLQSRTNVEFIIDVLTGSSAGGINAVFLSKALVNGAADMSDLQKLWLEQGDFARLLNDKHSVKDNSLDVPIAPESLLNSQRMYLELLKALDGLDKNPATRRDSANIDLLDLFVTYTDFNGLPTKIELSDKSVSERVHKRVFNFRYDPALNKNDFETARNPFLAFAARCTSSFPIAFEPMCLKNIDGILKLGLPDYVEAHSGQTDWLDYFDELDDEKGQPVDWTTRWFVDGGCLDNKPFGYAIDKLSKRTGEGIVERKLLYIEPNPESFRNPKKKSGHAGNLEEHEKNKPDALENVFGQAAGLPGYETIREDLRRVGDHNRLIERVAKLVGEIEEDLGRHPHWIQNPEKQPDWSKATLDDVGRVKGPAFIPYYRLRVSSTTDELARLVTRFFKIDPDSSYFNAIRFIVRAWREQFYSEDGKTASGGTLNKFLYEFDIEYRIRRIRFVIQKTEQMLRCSAQIIAAVKRLSKTPTVAEAAKNPDLVNQKQASRKMLENLQGVLPMEGALWEALPGADDGAKLNFAVALGEVDNQEKFVDAVVFVQRELNNIYLEVRRETEKLKENAGKRVEAGSNKGGEKIELLQRDLKVVEDKLTELGKQTALYQSAKDDQMPKYPAFAALETILEKGDASRESPSYERVPTARRDSLIRTFPEGDVDGLIDAINAAAMTLDEQILNLDGSFLRRGSNDAKRLLNIPEKDQKREELEAGQSDHEKFVKNYLRNYYQLFDSYDQISFPLYFESPVGEAVKVDVVRISSRDAHSLINEEDPNENRRKLAGDFLFAFGAFLDPRWRLNDIMWGRLDGAERLIQTLLPGEEFAADRKKLIGEANEIILRELLLQNATDDFRGAIVEALTLASTDAQKRKSVDGLVRKLETPAIETGLTNALVCALDPQNICEEVRKNYEVNRNLEPEPTLKILSRSTQIIGGILQNIADQNVRDKSPFSWISRLGQIFWGLVTVAAPNGIWNSIFNHWLQLIYLFEVILVVFATLFSKPDIQQFGIVALIVTIGINLTVIALQDVMLGKSFWKTLLRFLIGGSLAILVIAGALFVYSIFFDADAWKSIVSFRTGLTTEKYDRWQKIILIVPFIFLFVFITLWREVERLNLKLIGRWLFGAFAALTGLMFYFSQLLAVDGKEVKSLGAEFLDNGEALRNFVAGVTETGRVDALRQALWVDSLVFVPVYLSFLLILVALMKRRRGEVYGYLSPILAILVAGGVGADLLENRYMLAVLAENPIDWNAAAKTLLVLTSLKWALIFVVFGGAATIFLRHKEFNRWNIGMVPVLGGALIGLIGTFFYEAKMWGEPLLNYGVLIIAIGLLTAAIAFQFEKARINFFRGF